MIIGILSDTHGSISSQVLNGLKGVESIIHAGDVGGPDVIEILQRIAPVTAVRGNTDNSKWASALPIAEMAIFAMKTFYVLHDVLSLDLDPFAAGVDIVVHGHTHQYSIKTSNNILYFNPGSASVRRHGGPLSIGRITIEHGTVKPEIVHIAH